MDHFEPFERVTGRVSLKAGKICEAILKEACQKTGAEYHEAADSILISGTWEKISETRQIICNAVMDRSIRSSTSLPGISEASSHTLSMVTFDMSPHIAKYIKTIHGHDLKNFEEKYQVCVSWSKDNTKVVIKSIKSSESSSDVLFKMACDEFATTCQQFHKTVGNIVLDISQDFAGCSKEHVESLLCAVSKLVMVETSADGRMCILCGTASDLTQAKTWILQKVCETVKRPKYALSRGPTQKVCHHETVNKLKAVILLGDITKETVDMIVNASNKHLDHAGGVSYAISKAGGPSIQSESDDYVKKHGALKTGQVAVTGAGLLRCKYIAHAVGPQWSKHGREGCIKLFQTLFSNIYNAAIKLGARSMAMPAISSGIYGVPKEVCAHAVFSFFDEVDQRLESDPTSKAFEIRLVNIDGEIVQAFTQEFNKWRFRARIVRRRNSTGTIMKPRTENSTKRATVDDSHQTPRLKSSLVTFSKHLQSSTNHGQNSHTLVASKVQKNEDPSALRSRIKNRYGEESGYISSSSAAPLSNQERIPASSNMINQKKMEKIDSSIDPSSIPLPILSKNTARYSQSGTHSKNSGQSVDDSASCTICCCPYTTPVSLPKCGHTFCKDCINKAFTYQKKCPICQEVYGVCEGDQPDGTMNVKCLQDHSLPGYEGCGSYVIEYVIPDGRQGSRHPKPGHRFTGTKRRAFLPANEDGKVVLNMLQTAFERKLIFTVGRSSTSGQEDCVTWNDIHHKTSIKGGSQNFGYPDPTYLARVKDELKAKGIVPENENAVSCMEI